MRAPAEAGKANAALVALLAKELDVPRSSVAIMSGAKARLKIVSVQGDSETLAGKLPKLMLKTNRENV